MAEMDEWSDNEFRLFARMNLPPEAETDRWVQALYDAVLFTPEEDYTFREAARQGLKDRLYYDYGVVFDDVFDWDAYKLGGESNG
jgi:hypothetical protein